MPNLISLLPHRDAYVLFGCFDAVEQTKLNSTGVLGKNREVHAVTHPACAQRIWLTEKRSYRSHKRAAHLSGIGLVLAMMNGGGDNILTYLCVIETRSRPHNRETHDNVRCFNPDLCFCDLLLCASQLESVARRNHD